MSENLFDSIKKVNEHGQEFWSARDLYKLLGYTEYGKFLPAIERAKEACINSSQKVSDHFAQVSDKIKIGTGTQKEALREVDEYSLSRYACYLIAQNGNTFLDGFQITILPPWANYDKDIEKKYLDYV